MLFQYVAHEFKDGVFVAVVITCSNCATAGYTRYNLYHIMDCLICAFSK